MKYIHEYISVSNLKISTYKTNIQLAKSWGMSFCRAKSSNPSSRPIHAITRVDKGSEVGLQPSKFINLCLSAYLMCVGSNTKLSACLLTKRCHSWMLAKLAVMTGQRVVISWSAGHPYSWPFGEWTKDIG